MNSYISGVKNVRTRKLKAKLFLENEVWGWLGFYEIDSTHVNWLKFLSEKSRKSSTNKIDK